MNVTPALPRDGWRCGVSAQLRGVQYCEGVADALFEDVVGELPVGQGAGGHCCIKKPFHLGQLAGLKPTRSRRPDGCVERSAGYRLPARQSQSV
jgi:hypothetical protein